MRKIALLRTAFVLMIILFVSTTFTAQEVQSLEEAPYDIAYLRASKVSKPMVKVVYRRPSLADAQEQLSDKISYGSLWIDGASEIKFYNDTFVGETLVTAGTYNLLTIPGEHGWEIIVNNQAEAWSPHAYNPAANIAHMKVRTRNAERLAVFSMAFKTDNETTFLILGWDRTRIYIPIHCTNEPFLERRKFGEELINVSLLNH